MNNIIIAEQKCLSYDCHTETMFFTDFYLFIITMFKVVKEFGTQHTVRLLK